MKIGIQGVLIMLKLIKHEILKSKNMLIWGAMALITIEAAFVIGCVFEIEQLFSIGSFLFLLSSGFGMMGLLIYSILIYTMDISKKQGYMVFLTPNSAYKIIGAKLIVSLLALIIFFVVYLTFGILNSQLIADKSNEIFSNGKIKAIVQLFNSNITSDNIASVFLFGLNYLVQWFTQTIMIYFAITFTYTFLANVKFKGLIAFLILIGISSAFSWLASIPLASGMMEVSFNNDMSNGEALKFILDTKLLIFSFILNALVGAGLFFVTAKIADKKLSM